MTWRDRCRSRRSAPSCSSRRRSSRRQLQVSLPLEDHRIPQPSRASMWSGMVHTIHYWPHPIAPPCDLHAVLTAVSWACVPCPVHVSTCCCAGAVIDDAADAAHMPPCSASDHHPSRAGRPCSFACPVGAHCMWSAVTVRATQLEPRFPDRAAQGWRLSRPLDGHSSYMSLLAMRRARCP